jgi:transposase
MGGNGGEKLCATMNIPVCSSTLIRALHKQPMPTQITPRVLGIDDWAYKKGQRYRTALVDLEQRCIIDLLPDRETATVENWLEAHPGIEIVSRDRFINFTSGVSHALPNAVQVADRWHLFKNLGDAVQRVLAKAQSRIKKQSILNDPEHLTPKLKHRAAPSLQLRI